VHKDLQERQDHKELLDHKVLKVIKATQEILEVKAKRVK
tara:strand:- start:695 stop:811 length:117 start_codon:yes stop_codon:yes gene_type:complete